MNLEKTVKPSKRQEEVNYHQKVNVNLDQGKNLKIIGTNSSTRA